MYLYIPFRLRGVMEVCCAFLDAGDARLFLPGLGQSAGLLGYRYSYIVHTAMG